MTANCARPALHKTVKVTKRRKAWKKLPQNEGDWGDVPEVGGWNRKKAVTEKLVKAEV